MAIRKENHQSRRLERYLVQIADRQSVYDREERWCALVNEAEKKRFKKYQPLEEKHKIRKEIMEDEMNEAFEKIKVWMEENCLSCFGEDEDGNTEWKKKRCRRDFQT